MEGVAIAFMKGCLISGFTIGFCGVFFYFARKWNIGARFSISIVTGLMLGFLLPFIIAFPFHISNKLEESKSKSIANDEVNYFNDAISGKYSEIDIKSHYAKQPLSYKGAFAISIDKVPPKLIPVFIESFKNRGDLVGHLVNRPETPLDIKLKIADYPKHEAYISWMALNIDTPPQVLIRLSTNKDMDVAHDACKNKNAPKEAEQICKIRSSLKQSFFSEFKTTADYSNMFKSKKEELALWMLLVKDNREYVRMWVAQSRYTPSKILANLSNDPSDTILQFVFLHANTTPQIRHKIAKHFKLNVEAVLIELCKSNNDEIREAVAKSPISKHNVLKILSQDSDYHVYGAVAANPNATADMLESISKVATKRDYNNSGVLQLIVDHPNTPISVLEDFYEQTQNKKISGEAARAIRKRSVSPPS
ncbi:MAG: hypothetical protein A2076_13465 [Geobacteraceae bacterium GWC2_53_11]|nr:MAG: hypothetical protein A2076_13465 [Geobacteraceae bacterium GWC2_53_11]